jgi:putative endonuclease
MFYVYVLISDTDGQLYTGSTTDLKRRLLEHDAGKVRSTTKRRPLSLLYYEACLNESNARRREKYLKTGMGKRYLKQRLRDSLSEFVTV